MTSDWRLKAIFCFCFDFVELWLVWNKQRQNTNYRTLFWFSWPPFIKKRQIQIVWLRANFVGVFKSVEKFAFVLPSRFRFVDMPCNMHQRGAVILLALHTIKYWLSSCISISYGGMYSGLPVSFHYYYQMWPRNLSKAGRRRSRRKDT